MRRTLLVCDSIPLGTPEQQPHTSDDNSALEALARRSGVQASSMDLVREHDMFLQLLQVPHRERDCDCDCDCGLFVRVWLLSVFAKCMTRFFL
jgi:hypothetical protein